MVVTIGNGGGNGMWWGSECYLISIVREYAGGMLTCFLGKCSFTESKTLCISTLLRALEQVLVQRMVDTSTYC